MFKKKSAAKKGDSGWGDGDAFWGDGGGNAVVVDEPAKAESMPAAPPVAKRPLLEHLEPLFLYVCQQHRIAKESKAGAGHAFDEVRAEVKRKMDAIESAARYDPVLRQHLDKIRDPIYWYLDSTFGSPDNAFSFRQKWNDQRLGDYGEDGNLSGDDAFFDELDRELENDSRDESANERLAFYYVAIGLGFTGCWFKRTADHRQKLKDLMQRIYPRVSKYVDADASGRVTPEAYRFTDKRDFVAPSRDKPLVFFIAFMLFLGTLLIGYIYWYTEVTKEVRDGIGRFSTTTGSAEGD